MSERDMGTPLSTLQGVGEKVSARLLALGVQSVEDLLFLLPRAYQDRSSPLPVAGLSPGSTATVRGQVLTLRERPYRRRRTLEMLLSDGTGLLVLKWFHYSRWLKEGLERKYVPGTVLLATGRVDTFAGTLEMHHPELSREDEGRGIFPIYPLTEGLNHRLLRKLVSQALSSCLGAVNDILPLSIRESQGLPPLAETLEALHRPAPGADVQQLNRGESPWHQRLRFEELFLFQVGLLARRRSLESERALPLRARGELSARFRRGLPFALTSAQERCSGEILGDLERDSPMHRLLQGDVGSGKTLVAFLAMLQAAECGRQAVIMAPTEVLAEQHYRTMGSWCESVGLQVGLLTGSLGAAKRKAITESVRKGSLPLLVGTHAVIQEAVEFKSLALAVVDEQHRFGVLQRLSLRRKGLSPHFLVMTATPIPRSLAMVLYGDLDISTIDELPPGRVSVRTEILAERDRARLHLAVDREVRSGRQAYIVYPLVEETERTELMAAQEMAQRYREKVFPHLRIGLVTGRMPSDEKEKVMEAFRLGEYQVLVATTVIEVGVDVPNATLMVVEHAERFGLFQLHQLRGRVGRGEHPSTCILMVGPEVSAEARERLRVMTRTNSGFEVAEADLRLRGPGDFLGVRQSGLPDFKFAHPMRDRMLMDRARKAAEGFLEGRRAVPPEMDEAVRRLWSGQAG